LVIYSLFVHLIDTIPSGGPVSSAAGRAPGRDKRLVEVSGADHGTALLFGPTAATVLPAVLTFLHQALSPGSARPGR
jgi:hypothetical protein